MKQRTFYIILLIGVLLWCTLIILPPLFMNAGSSFAPLAEVLYKSFSHVCHQYDSRSIHIDGYKFAVCGRCTAIYFGFLFGVLLIRQLSRRSLRPSVIWWVIAIVPMIVDVAADVLGLSSSTMITRLLTGGWFGIFSAVILTPYFIEACLEIFHYKSQGIPYESKA